MPSISLSNALSEIALASLVNECTGMTVASLPPATMYSPVGSTSTPCGDLGVGRKYTTPSQSRGSSTFTLVSVDDLATREALSTKLWRYRVGVDFALPDSTHDSARL